MYLSICADLPRSILDQDYVEIGHFLIMRYMYIFISGLLCTFPATSTCSIIVYEEKYTFTPDDFKAATWQKRVKENVASLAHLKTVEEMLNEDKFDKRSLVTTAEGKSLGTTHLAKQICYIFQIMKWFVKAIYIYKLQKCSLFPRGLGVSMF